MKREKLHCAASIISDFTHRVKHFFSLHFLSVLQLLLQASFQNALELGIDILTGCVIMIVYIDNQDALGGTCNTTYRPKAIAG